MHIVHVDIHVRADHLAPFLAATLANARGSLTEPGVLRFDVVQDRTDPAHIVLVEVYRDSAAANAHKLTDHYAIWRDAVAELMARPRTSQLFSEVYPTDTDQWGTGG